jgi:four helix bundle protein
MKFPHESLVAWQRADDLFISVHLLSKKKFPVDERFALTSQARRAAFSVAANIVEGRARKHDRERAQFLRTAWGRLLKCRIVCTPLSASDTFLRRNTRRSSAKFARPQRRYLV